MLTIAGGVFLGILAAAVVLAIAYGLLAHYMAERELNRRVDRELDRRDPK